MITIKEYTTKAPLQMIGEFSGICWGANVEDRQKNIKRAWDCIESGHGRTEEFPDVYVVIDGYSAKCLRELYTHIGGSPTRLQASTRYIDYAKGFDAVEPPSVASNPEAEAVWRETLNVISVGMNKLKELGVPKEDYTNLLPLAYRSKMVWKVNLRTLVNFFGMRLCNRAYHEIRALARELKDALSEYSPEWKEIADALFVPKCVHVGFFTEAKSCHYRPPKSEINIVWEGGNHDPQ